MSKQKPPSGAYTVGYKKPPTHTQFKKGQSGNPKGRTPGSPNLHTMVDRVFSRKLIAKENGKERRITAMELMLRQIMHKSVGGDLGSQRMSINLLTLPRGEGGTATSLFESDNDRAILRSLYAELEGDDAISATKPKKAPRRKGGA